MDNIIQMQINTKIKLKNLQNPETQKEQNQNAQQLTEKTSLSNQLNKFQSQVNNIDPYLNQFLFQHFSKQHPQIQNQACYQHKIGNYQVGSQNKFYQNIEPIVHSKCMNNQQLEGESIKIYPKFGNTFQQKQIRRLTFGPQQFTRAKEQRFQQKMLEVIPQVPKQKNSVIQTKQNKIKYSDGKSNQKQKSRQKEVNNKSPAHMSLYKQQNKSKQRYKQIEKQKQLQIKSTAQLKLEQDLKKKPKIYNIMCKQTGMSQQKVFKLKSQSLNYQLGKFIRKKGIQYLQQNRKVTKRVATQNTQRQKESIVQNNKAIIHKNTNKKIPQDSKMKKGGQQKGEKELNPDVLPKIGKRNSSKKTIFSQGAIKQRQRGLYRAQSKKQMKYKILTEQEQILGKIVYNNVKDYFKLDKDRADYFTKVKKQEQIDETWIQLLRTKVQKANQFFIK